MREPEDLQMFSDPALLPVAEQLSWLTTPFADRAERIVEKTGLPDWKLPEVKRNLEQLFIISQQEGKSYLIAVAALDAVINNLLR